MVRGNRGPTRLGAQVGERSREFGGGGLEVVLDAELGDAAGVDGATWVGSLRVRNVVIRLIKNESPGNASHERFRIGVVREDTENFTRLGGRVSFQSDNGVGQLQPFGASEVVGKVIKAQLASHPAR